MVKHDKFKTCLSALTVARREIYHWVSMIVFLVVISGTAKPGGEAAHAGSMCVRFWRSMQDLAFQQRFVLLKAATFRG